MLYKSLGKTGLEVSALAFGCTTLGNEYGVVGVEEGKQAVHYAIDNGINFFDTSPYYGRTMSETRLGEALVGYRDKVILMTKAGRYDRPLETGFDFSYDRVIRSAEESMQRLKTDYLDVFHLHDIEFRPKEQIINEGIPALQKLKQEGKVRFIGVTGFPVHLLREMVETQDIDVTLSYCHYNLMNTRLMDILAPATQAKGVGLVNASVLHMSVLTDEPAVPDWHPAPAPIFAAARQAAEYCHQHGVALVDLALQFALDNPAVDSTLVGMGKVSEVEQNLKIVGTKPDPEILAAVQEILRPVHNTTWASGLPENYEPDFLQAQ